MSNTDLRLDTCDPLGVVATRSLDEIEDALPAAATWNREVDRSLDAIYAHLVVAALGRADNQAEVGRLRRHLGLAIARREEVSASLGVSYSERWRAWQDLLERRLEPKPVSVRLKHVPTILRWLERHGGSARQSDILSELDLGSKGNASRILSVMFRDGVVEKSRIGKEMRVFLTPQGYQYCAAWVPTRRLVAPYAKKLFTGFAHCASLLAHELSIEPAEPPIEEAKLFEEYLPLGRALLGTDWDRVAKCVLRFDEEVVKEIKAWSENPPSEDSRRRVREEIARLVRESRSAVESVEQGVGDPGESP